MAFDFAVGDEWQACPSFIDGFRLEAAMVTGCFCEIVGRWKAQVLDDFYDHTLTKFVAVVECIVLCDEKSTQSTCKT